MTLASCAQCERDIPAHAALGLCPSCVLRPKTGDELPSHIGDYAILSLLGEGGAGVVYLARQERPPFLTVALKVMRAGEFADAQQTATFLDEVLNQGRLRHPNIVQIFDGRGLDHGAPFFVMQYVDGGTLADPEQQDYFASPARAAQLMLEVARAVQFAHEAGVLHLDLKPANILLDRQRRPYVSDFSIAQRLQTLSDVPDWAFAGSLGYMAPELVCSDTSMLSTSCDVYGLGATLYELLTGQLPYHARSLQELAHCFAHEHAVAPRTRAPSISLELERVCLGAIEKDPSRRYRSAAAFAEDLERALQHLPTSPPNAPRPGLPRRAALWARRHPLLAAAALVGAALLVVVDVMSAGALHQLHDELLDLNLRANAALALQQARDVHSEFGADSERVSQVYRDPALANCLRACRADDITAALRRVVVGFDSVFLVGADGVPRARFPAPPTPDYYRQDFSQRDYFRGASELTDQGQVHLSSAFHSNSTSDNLLKFAFSTPIRNADGSLLGVFVATQRAASSLRSVQIDELYGSGQLTTLLGPHEQSDRSSPAGTQVSFDVLIHKQLSGTKQHRIEPQLAERLARHIAARGTGHDAPWLEGDYRDPVPHFEGRWLAGFARVPGTRYVVLVQSKWSHALGPTKRLLASLASYAGILHAVLLLLAALAIGATLFPSRQRRLPG